MLLIETPASQNLQQLWLAGTGYQRLQVCNSPWPQTFDSVREAWDGWAREGGGGGSAGFNTGNGPGRIVRAHSKGNLPR